MKKYLSLLVAILLVLTVTGCGKNAEIIEKANLAKDFVDPLFVEKMSQSEYTVTHIATGYYTENGETVYLVGYTYTVPTSETPRQYGYKVAVDDSGKCTVLEHNAATGHLLFTED